MRRSARVAAAADMRTSALPQLPPSLALRVFLLLPVDQRARACCVCRGWRGFLADPALWTRLDLSPGAGVSKERLTDAFLRGAAAKAQGQLERLGLDLQCAAHALSQTAVYEVALASAGSLRELRLVVPRLPCAEWNDVANLEALARAAPLLRRLEARVACKWEDAPRLMRADPPLTALQLHGLSVTDHEDVPLDRVTTFAAALADTALQTKLERLCFAVQDITRPEVLDTLVDAVLARRQLCELEFIACSPPAPAPLARLLRGSALAILQLFNDPEDPSLLDTAGAVLVADALRANTTLQVLTLDSSRLCDDVPAACVLLRALVGHSSLRELKLQEENPDDGAAIGAALAELIAADTPVLQSLYLRAVRLNDEGLAPIMDALPQNHHLRKLDISRAGATEAFSRDRMLPAIRANTSLRWLECDWTPAQGEAWQLVYNRTPRVTERGRRRHGA